MFVLMKRSFWMFLTFYFYFRFILERFSVDGSGFLFLFSLHFGAFFITEKSVVKDQVFGFYFCFILKHFVYNISDEYQLKAKV